MTTSKADKNFATELRDFMAMLREAVGDTGEVTLTEETLDELDEHIMNAMHKERYESDIDWYD